MMRPHPKGYLAPWSSRRESAGLMGTFLIFLLGFPGHSELMMDQTRHLFSQLVQLTLVFLGLTTPVGQNFLGHSRARQVAARQEIVVARKSAGVKEANSMYLRMEPVLHKVSYLFEGKAADQDRPCANASVLVRLTSGDRTVTQRTVTNADGTYSLQVAIDVAEKDPVDWKIEAYTPEFNKVELSGRRIVQLQEEQDKKPIVVTNPVEFVVSLSK